MKKLTKVIVTTLAMASILALNPIGVNAEWKQNDKGWWYTEGDSWSVGWRVIDGHLYYFDTMGYMFNTPRMFSGSYGLNSDGQFMNVTIDGDWAFERTTGIIVAYVGSNSDVVIPNTIDDVTITGIGVKAFQNCNSLKSITIPSNITSIGMDAFCFCNNLTSATILDGVNGLGDVPIFINCSNLTSISIPDSLTSISTGTVFNCINAKYYVNNEEMKQNLINSGIEEDKIIVNV